MQPRLIAAGCVAAAPSAACTSAAISASRSDSTASSRAPSSRASREPVERERAAVVSCFICALARALVQRLIAAFEDAAQASSPSTRGGAASTSRRARRPAQHLRQRLAIDADAAGAGRARDREVDATSRASAARHQARAAAAPARRSPAAGASADRATCVDAFELPGPGSAGPSGLRPGRSRSCWRLSWRLVIAAPAAARLSRRSVSVSPAASRLGAAAMATLRLCSARVLAKTWPPVPSATK